MYHSKPWVPENVSPSVASFVSTRPTFGSQTSSRKPTEASAHNSYSKFAISGEIERELDDGRLKRKTNVSGKPLVQHSNGLEDQESLETHSFVYLAPPPNPKNGSLAANLSPVLRQTITTPWLDCIHDMTIIIVSGYRTTQIDNHTQEMATDVRSLVQRHSF